MLLLSIRPKYVDAILAGEKRVELRRRRPKIERGQALVYATSPRMELVGSIFVSKVVRSPLELLWQSVGADAGVTRREFDAYFVGLQAGVAIHISEVTQFCAPLSLDGLRALWKGFQPPQSFRYMHPEEIAKLMDCPVRRAA